MACFQRISLYFDNIVPAGCLTLNNETTKAELNTHAFSN